MGGYSFGLAFVEPAIRCGAAKFVALPVEGPGSGCGQIRRSQPVVTAGVIGASNVVMFADRFNNALPALEVGLQQTHHGQQLLAGGDPSGVTKLGWGIASLAAGATAVFPPAIPATAPIFAGGVALAGGNMLNEITFGEAFAQRFNSGLRRIGNAIAAPLVGPDHRPYYPYPHPSNFYPDW